MASSAFTLIYDLLHDTQVPPAHLPWVYASLHTLSTMRGGDPITSTISAIQTTLRNINPAYEWSPYPKTEDEYLSRSEGDPSLSQMQRDMKSSQVLPNSLNFSASSPSGPRPDLPTTPWNFSQFEAPETGRSGGSSEDLLDFTQSDMGWNFDFSTMDMEAFFSVYQSADATFT